MGKLSTVFAAVLAAASVAAASAQTRPQAGAGLEDGFFRPAADPALTSIRPPPVPGAPAAAQPPRAATADIAQEIREAEEALMDRAEVEHVAAQAQAVPRAPAITSPLDGTAPILSPLDGTAPIISPVGR